MDIILIRNVSAADLKLIMREFGARAIVPSIAHEPLDVPPSEEELSALDKKILEGALSAVETRAGRPIDRGSMRQTIIDLLKTKPHTRAELREILIPKFPGKNVDFSIRNVFYNTRSRNHIYKDGKLYSWKEA